MQEVLVNPLGGLSLPWKSVVRLTDRPDMTLDVNRGRKTTIQQQQSCIPLSPIFAHVNRLLMQSSAKHCIGMFKDFDNIQNSKKRCPTFFREKTNLLFYVK